MLRRRLRYQKKRLAAAAWRVLMAYPRLVECNLCHWEGRAFRSDSWHRHTVCPRCMSQVRHRLLAAALDGPLSGAVRGKRLLHFSPELAVQDLLRSRATAYTTADYHGRKVDLDLDISSMPSVREGSFDAVVACDILEHVRDDKAAMRELLRVLTPGGYAILTVPQKDHLAQTFEDLSVTDPKERERLFGQHDHLRIYGDDFRALLESTGFRVTVVDERSFPAPEARRHVLAPAELSTRPLATNFRKVFFAQRP